MGYAYLGNALDLCARVPEKSVDLVMTSPPFALLEKKRYGNVSADSYVGWFSDFAREFERILADRGSLVIHIGGSWNRGQPTRTLYNFKLLLSLANRFHLAQEFYWYNPAKLPAPAEWVNVQRIRVKDAVDPVWWFSKSTRPKASNTRVLKDYSPSMNSLLSNGYTPGLRPSGHRISGKFKKRHKGAIPPNILTLANTDSNSAYLTKCREAKIAPHPARYPEGIPEFFIKFLTTKGDLVLDPFGGSNTTGAVAERLGRRWVCLEIVREYLKGSKFRFKSLL
jgi:site-specific DNA-methyltransferase (cytosine-N4-specific)